MPQQIRQALDRASRESSRLVRSTAASNEDSVRHVVQSHEAVERSLELLRETRAKAS